ncbi:MAG TPA: phosphoadenylyl-sulfate reductase [Egibacteraceae bacterium]|nr:phosphoadenylyl-sulfate reductase [Egibacteraceae bacterium]
MSLTVDVAGAARDLEEAPATEILRWAIAEVPRFAVSSSFGADSAVLLHLLSTVDAGVPVLFLETGFHFPETLRYRRDLAALLGLTDVRDLRAQLTVAEQAREHGGGLYVRDADACCAIRKVEPLNRALREFDGWASGVRREQTPERADTPVVQTVTREGRDLVKVSPLARWSAQDVEDYLAAHALPRHPLAEAGYPSIGCAPCTRAVAPGEDPRAGRWAGSAKTECGIHIELPGEAVPVQLSERSAR